MSLRDIDIRAPLHAWLSRTHEPDGDTSIIHELSIPRPSARVDIAVVNGKICGFEIKSDVDRLSRLAQQEPAFSAVFDRVSVVTTIRHLKRATRIVPHWWGIIIADGAESDVRFVIKRKAKENKNASTENLLYMLTRKELIEMLRRDQIVKGISKMRQRDLIVTIIKSISRNDVRTRAREILKRRPTISYHSSSSLTS